MPADRPDGKEQKAMEAAFTAAFPLRPFQSDAELDSCADWRSYFEAGYKAALAARQPDPVVATREDELREALKDIIETRGDESTCTVIRMREIAADALAASASQPVQPTDDEIEQLLGELEAGIPWTNYPWKDADEAVRAIVTRLRKMTEGDR